MKKYNLHKKAINIIALIIVSVIYTSCNDTQSSSSCMPKSSVSAAYNLNLPLYNTLLTPNSYVELSADGTNGGRGIIIVNTGSGYRAYDRNAPHICPTTNSTLTVENSSVVVCPEDDSQWLLLTGQPLNDTTDGYALYQYTVTQSGSYLYIN